jgi:NADH dehydrogenase
MSNVLVVGGTGLLGLEVARLLATSQRRVRALVRDSAAPAKRTSLQALGVEAFPGDLKDAALLVRACEGVGAIVATASATVSRQPADSIETVDGTGYQNLIEAAERAGVRHFVFVSFAPVQVDFALQRAKRATEARLKSSKLTYTILQPWDFTEVWLSPALGFDPVHGTARVFGSGENPVSWISLFDVARFAAHAVDGAQFVGKVVVLGGPDPLSPLQVVRMFEELGHPKVAVENVPEAALEAQLKAAGNAVEEAYAALMLATARGLVLDPQPALDLLPGQLRTVREYVRQSVKRE